MEIQRITCIESNLARASRVEGGALYLRVRAHEDTWPGMEYDTFYITTSKLLSTESVTKRILVSDIAKVFDVLGWFAPAVISVKILGKRNRLGRPCTRDHPNCLAAVEV
jgi:hypothetical protein